MARKTKEYVETNEMLQASDATLAEGHAVTLANEVELDSIKQAITADQIAFSQRVGARIGRRAIVDAMAKIGDVTDLLELQELKETKQYKGLSVMVDGKVVTVTTWDEYCVIVEGRSREQVDEDLRNLKAFAEGHAVTLANGAELIAIKGEYSEERDLANQLLGQAQMAGAFEDFSRTVRTSKLAFVKENKLYRALKGKKSPHGAEILAGTWDEYCSLLGRSVDQVDRDIANLRAFGEEALESMSRMGIGYRELRQVFLWNKTIGPPPGVAISTTPL